MVKTTKAKISPKKVAAKTKARPVASAKGVAKYDQPGAPWWKKLPLPT